MANRITTSHNKPFPRILYWTSIVAAILGAIDATYLIIYKISGNNAMCIGNGGCHDVNFSPYSELYGIPVAAYGLAAYLVIIAIHLLETRRRFFKNNGPLLLFGISLAGVAFSAYLTYLELDVIHAVCPFCVASAVLISIIFIVAIIRLVVQTAL